VGNPERGGMLLYRRSNNVGALGIHPSPLNRLLDHLVSAAED